THPSCLVSHRPAVWDVHRTPVPFTSSGETSLASPAPALFSEKLQAALFARSESATNRSRRDGTRLTSAGEVTEGTGHEEFFSGFALCLALPLSPRVLHRLCPLRSGDVGHELHCHLSRPADPRQEPKPPGLGKK